MCAAKPNEPEPTKMLAVKVPCSLSKRVHHYAIDHDMSAQEVTILALETFLKAKNA